MISWSRKACSGSIPRNGRRGRVSRAPKRGLRKAISLAPMMRWINCRPTLSPRESVEAKLYAAQLLAVQGHINEALARLRVLEQTDYPPVAAKATYVLVETALAAKKMTPADAIETLEQLRYRWRGDDLELNTLRKLGSLYFAASRWRDGLGALRIASIYFAGSDLARDAQDDMRRAFTDLFLGGKADAMPPVEALALFYDFIELTPVGSDGDEMIRRLSDRLVAVDLLGPAEQLLDHQVNERLDGVARAAVATKLATHLPPRSQAQRSARHDQQRHPPDAARTRSTNSAACWKRARSRA